MCAFLFNASPLIVMYCLTAGSGNPVTDQYYSKRHTSSKDAVYPIEWLLRQLLTPKTLKQYQPCKLILIKEAFNSL